MRNYRKMDTRTDPPDAIKARYWAEKKARQSKPTPLQVLILRAFGMPIPVHREAVVDRRARASGHHRQWKRRRASGWDRR